MINKGEYIYIYLSLYKIQRNDTLKKGEGKERGGKKYSCLT